MRNWKELGEVPDSDDDSLDIPESQDEIQHVIPLDSHNADTQLLLEQQPDDVGKKTIGNDIWDIPLTPEEGKRDNASGAVNPKKPASSRPLASKPHLDSIRDLPPSPKDVVQQDASREYGGRTPPARDFDGPPFSPLSSSLSDLDDIDDIDELGILPAARATVGVSNGPDLHNGLDPVASQRVTFERDEISTSYVTITAPRPGPPTPSSGSANQGPISTTPTPRRSGNSSLIVELATSARKEPASDWREASASGRRSLRPRKPIQQHPYLLESVQYAHVMKSHGVKPVRVVIPEASPVRGTVTDDSQDREFEEQSSEERLASRPLRTDESQPILFDDMGDDRDELGLSPSPPRTSPRNMFQDSSQRSEADRTDNTSILEDDFPTVEELVRRPPRTKAQTLKRQLSSKLLSHTKRLRGRPTSSAEPSSPSVSRYKHVSMDPPSSPVTNALYAPSQDLAFEDSPVVSRAAHAGSPASPAPLAVSSHLDPSSRRSRPPVIDLTKHLEANESSDTEASSSSSSSRSGSEVVRRNGKRIRGVLPASWLRIDKQKTTGPQRKTRRTPEASPEPTVPRRGVAVRKVSSRVSSPRRPTSTLPLFSDESDDDEATTARPIPVMRQSSPDDSPLTIWSDQEDTGLVIEEDQIDRMLVGAKRKRSFTDLPSAMKRRKTTHNNTFRGQAGVKNRQPRITDVLERNRGKKLPAPSAASKAKQRHARSHKSGRSRAPASRAITPPLLSVLDFVDSNSQAPPFLKIAARTAKRRQDLGKASPTHKHINLGTRKDNVDALSVLRDWKSGRIPSKTAKPQTKPATARRPLRSLSSNCSPISTRDPGYVQPCNPGGGRLDPVNLDDHYQDTQTPRTGPRKAAVPAQRMHSWAARPAQLETEENESPDRAGFHVRKRALDVLFRNARKASSASSVRLEQQWDSIRLANVVDEQTSEPSFNGREELRPTPKRKNAKSRFRKRLVPKPVDLQAAHYVHANDPLPPQEPEAELLVSEEPEERRPPDRLYGLAPYGTKYTYHFEVFPLDRGVYFHSSSLVGAGWIHKLVDTQYPGRTRQTRPRTFFSIDGKDLKWGSWDETASSELGILVDWIAEQLLSPDTTSLDARNVGPREATAFLLAYVVDSISFPDEVAEESFVSRIAEVVDGLLNRVDEARSSSLASAKLRQHGMTEVLTYLTLVMQAVHRISGSTMSQKFQIETLLIRTAQSCVADLLACGLEDLRSLYGELQRLSVRERGIRSDCISANSWVVLMRVLENARLPRASFWDVTERALTRGDVMSGLDVRAFEHLWRDLFTLLPLSEVDDFGVVKCGLRHTTPVEGWTLPQKLLKRVFSLYMTNPRQPPGFNEYCRALAARCHYLVQEWGWRKCAGIVGTWFDFFGSQNLSHLRNEEVYKSPRFLEELSGSPSLAIDPEDRCFHIFLKLLAMVIQRLKKLGLTNDIKNLVARTLPNHNRQYLKEDTVHQRDLAALRNHHDLLCTLFWAAPPELRPAVHLVEKLVPPGSSHKEACLINLRAWGQLARFVVSSGEGSATFKPFVTWQNNIFGQVLDQYLSAASDIQQQILAMPRDGPRIGDEVVESMVKQNRSVAMDMLFVSLKSSFEVLKLAGSLGVATYALNIYQLQQIFTRFDVASRDFDWTIVTLAIDVLEHYVSRVERASEQQYSSDSTDMVESQDLEEAILLLDHNLAEKLFSLNRTMLELPAAEGGSPSELVRCIERTVKLSARVACRFIHSGFTRTANYFMAGKYGVFRELPLKLGSQQRKFLPLFVATLIKNHVYDFKDVGATLFQLWMVMVAKPLRASAYENHLAEILKQRNLPYMEQVTVIAGEAPDYRSKFELFQSGVSYMRKELRKADSNSGRQLRDEYAKTLQSVMQKMKEDLGALRPVAMEHRQYMDFVRRVIALIKSHGVGICVVDSFFTQPSADYSPPMEDPQLHTAGIIAYGVRLGEGDAMAVSQLFYYLFNNFKIALINDKLDEEVRILENAMSNGHVFSFVLTRALPAIIWATSKIYEAWPHLDVYLAALRNLLTRSILPKEVSEDSLVHVASVLSNVLTWFRTLRGDSGSGLTKIQLHIMTQLMDLVALFQPSLLAHLYSLHEADTAKLQQSYTSMAQFARDASDYLDDIFQPARQSRHAALTRPDMFEPPVTHERPALSRIQISLLCRGIPDFDHGPIFQSGRELDPQVDGFANEIVRDVRRNWAVTESSISLNAPGRGSSVSSTQSRPGTRYELLGEDALFGRLRDRLKCWVPDAGLAGRRPGRRRKWRAEGSDTVF